MFSNVSKPPQHRNLNTTAYQAATAMQKAAYATQAYVEVYTGDLSPYTSKVSYGAGVAYRWVSGHICTAYHWLLAQDWQGLWDATLHLLATIASRIQVT